MNRESSLAQLLQWRASHAEAEAPSVPSAQQLLAFARPWWEQWPQRFQRCLVRLGSMHVVYGHAMTSPLHGRGGHPVATLLIDDDDEVETAARVLYLSVRDGVLRFRFQLDGFHEDEPNAFDVSLISDVGDQLLLTAVAERSPDHEFRLDAPVSDAIAQAWGSLRVTDRMPFRLMLRATTDLS